MRTSGIEFTRMFRDALVMPSEKPRILGIDGGGTKTEWVLVEDGEVVQRGVLAQSNLRLNTDEQLAQLFAVMPRDATHVGAFLAACATLEDQRRLERLVRECWPAAKIVVGSDRDSAIATAFRGEDGIVVIGGTGAAVHGRRMGRVEKAGGWGHVVGDRGGGYDLARQALREVLTRFDLDQRISPLAERILRELSLNSLRDLATWAMDADKMSVARLAPAVFTAARQGEAAMLGVIEGGANVLTEFVKAVALRLEWPDATVRLFGGLFAHHEDYAALFKMRLSFLLPRASVEVCRESGAMGAAWLALEGERPREPLATGSRGGSSPSLAAAATEQSNPRSVRLDEMSAAEVVELFASEEERVAEALVARRDDLVAAVELVCGAMSAGGRLFHVGAGTSGRLGVLDASEIPPTFGASPELVQGIMAGGALALHRAVEGAEDQREGGALAVVQRGVRAGDVVCGITASGRTPFVLGALEKARALGAKTLLLTCNPVRERTGWDVEVDLPTGAEIVTGSTRLKAGTATKVVLNLLSTAAMVRLGHVQGNRMIDVGISNEKLRDRGARMVAEALAIPYGEARQRLEAASWNVRTFLDRARGKS
jgi:N-acetylmuramic acid 6-phosphate etherase